MNSSHRKDLVVLVTAVLSLAGLSFQIPWAAPPELTIRDRGTFNGYESVGNAINDRGQVVGSALVAPDESRSFLWEAGVMTDLGPGNLIATDINNRGQILMQSRRNTPHDPNACFLRDGDATVDLGNLGGTTCGAADLNNKGQVVGSIGTEAPPFPTTRAFLWESGVMIDLGTLGGNYAYAAAINDRGQIVGASTVQHIGNLHAFLWERGEMIDLGSPGGPQSAALAINNRGQVVLWSGSHVYIWEAGSMTDLGTFGGDYTYPIDINERGQILFAVHQPSTLGFRDGLWEKGTLTWLPSLGSGQPRANHLNNRGVIVGADRESATDPYHVVLWAPGNSSGPGHTTTGERTPGRLDR